MRALDPRLGAGQERLDRALGGYDLGEALGALQDVFRMSQLVTQHLRVSLDLAETLEADEGNGRIGSRSSPGVLDVPGHSRMTVT